MLGWGDLKSSVLIMFGLRCLLDLQVEKTTSGEEEDNWTCKFGAQGRG